MSRIVCWFSCGAASAVATKMAIAQNAGKLPLVVARCWIKEEHEDNDRFARECEQWFGVPIITLTNEKYGGSVRTVIEKERYINGVRGASCTKLLKKRVREQFQQHGDVHVFGYTAEEADRIDRFVDGNNDLKTWFILQEAGLMHADTMAMVERAGISLPRMYGLGYKHNNCKACNKAEGPGYWNKVRIDFPDEFRHRAEASRALGVKMVKIDGERTFLDELPTDVGNYKDEPEVQCGIFCELAEKDYAA
jgi:hypothetical protein